MFWFSYIYYWCGKKCFCVMVYEWFCYVYLFLGKFLKKVFVLIMEDIIDGMMGYIFLYVIMEKILVDYGSYLFGDFCFIILNMFSVYGYEWIILVCYLLYFLEFFCIVCNFYCFF